MYVCVQVCIDLFYIHMYKLKIKKICTMEYLLTVYDI
jgi:hypothetical protein